MIRGSTNEALSHRRIDSLKFDVPRRSFHPQFSGVAVSQTIDGNRTNGRALPSTRDVSGRTFPATTVSKKEATAFIQALLNEIDYPLGSLTPQLYMRAKNALDVFVQDRYDVTTDAQAINDSIDLLERLVREMALAKQDNNVELLSHQWFCKPRYFNPLVSKWKEAAIARQQKVIPPQELLQKLQNMSALLPEYRYNIVTVSMIMQVGIQQAPPNNAPLVAERLLQFIETKATQMDNDGDKSNGWDLKPDVYMYNMILNAWAKSKLPEAPQRMEALLTDMHRHGIAPNSVSYSILVRFWSGKEGDLDKLEEILGTMEHERIKPDLASWASILHCYTNVGQTQKAEEILQSMIDERTVGNIHDENAIRESMEHIMLAYRRVIAKKASTESTRRRALDFAEAFLQKMNRSDILDAQSYGEFRVMSSSALLA